MHLYNLSILIKMAFDKNVIKSLYETYIFFKEDKNFNFIRYLKLMTSMLKGEKIISFEDKYIISPFLPPFPSKAFDANIRAVENPKQGFTQQIYAKRSAPISMYIALTHGCPNNCVYCSAKNNKDKEDLTTEQWKRTIQEIQDMGTPIIGLTGGEPMLREDIFDIIGGIDDRSTSTLFTSGYNLTLEKAKKLKSKGLFSIGISLDSYEKEKHNKNRNSEKAFDNALNAIRNARRAGIYTIAQTVVLKNQLNEGELLKLFQLAGETGAHEVKILEPILSGNLLTKGALKDIFYTPKDREKLIKIQHKANKIRSLPKVTTFAYTESEAKYGCGAGTQHSYISAAGDLYPCDFIPMTFGSIKKESIQKLWRQMNDLMGIPKTSCFAQKVNDQVYEKAHGVLPLCTEEATRICKLYQSDKFPKYYRNLQ